MKIHTYFHWAYHKFGWNHKYNLGTGLFIWLFLLLTRPFGVYVTDFKHFLALAVLLLPVGVSFVVVSYFTDYLFRKWLSLDLTAKPNIDAWAWIAKLFLFVHVVYVMILIRCNWECFEVIEYVEQWFASALMILMTYIPLALYGRSKFFHSLVGEKGKDESLSIHGEGKDRLIVNVDEIILAKADDNYVDFFFLDSEVPSKKTIRSTLTSITDQLSSHPQFQRVHRSFLVNLKFAEKQNSKLLIVKNGNWSMEVPLSPSYKDSIQELVS